MLRTHTCSLVSALIGLLGLWLVLRQVPDFASSLFISLSAREDIPADLLRLYGANFAVTALLGIVLSLLRERLARWLVPAESATTFQVRSLLAVGAAALGVYFVALGGMSLGESFAVEQSANRSNPYLFWRGIIAVVVGLCLFLGSVGISRLWALLAGLRRAGV